MTNHLQTLLQTFAHFNQGELDKIVACFKPKQVKKNNLLLEQGNVCKEFYYIQTGGLRTFFIDKNGHEKTRYIMLDNQVGTTLTSFISQQPSFELMEAIEDTQLLAINHQDFYQLNKKMDHWKIFYHTILERAYSFQNKKIESLVTLSAKQRYEQLLKDHPVFVQRLSNKVLASYLDMREETLSRLKST
jgi:CRP-like cAMP-binding protein